ncbi:uncharacterized protein BDZ99DRAFT_461616 [Mytilinidion resinicola]|uniref:Uncharacterized protein n=1 Tax=Mytilinidion resinicola TaxID=574789 RepID=A0A6A6YU89_9PEZI|nr:uncharacterized protein BDZ99DRAFT_461616 [Mytilinidion resinicola]KAF2811594.1 hypothetical protein BDZ99DRAFT_461616 [Mytilinidion resinicola]
MTTAAPIPVVICGARAETAKSVIAGLAPEYEVIHVILSTSVGVAALPSILSCADPSAENSELEPILGSHNYSAPPFAIIAGGGHDDSSVASMQASVRDHKVQVPWLRHDPSKPAPPVGPEYGKHVVKRVRECLEQLLAKSPTELDEVRGKVVWY